MDFTVVSFYTNDWIYPDHAARLRDDCDRLALKHHIVERPSTNEYVGNCQIKPFFIRECMEEFKSPVFWMDADGSILQKPDRLFDDENSRYDLVANRPINDHTRIHVGSMLINYTDATRSFVDAWCDVIQRKRPLDDAAFNSIWSQFKDTIKLKLLPDNYFFIQKILREAVPKNTVILHRLSNSDIKLKYKALVER